MILIASKRDCNSRHLNKNIEGGNHDSKCNTEMDEKITTHQPEFADMYLTQSNRIMKDGAIPAKYKILMTMIVDAIMAHPRVVLRLPIVPVQWVPLKLKLTKLLRWPIYLVARQP